MTEIARRLISRWIPDAQTPLGRVIRWPIRVIPSGITVPVLTGPNRGFRWTVGASVHGCWIGNYEREFADRLDSRLAPGNVFYDIGARAGYYTLLGSRAVGPRGQVVAFEPAPDNLSNLKRHLSLNGIENVTVVEAAVLDRDAEVSLAVNKGPSQVKVSEQGSLSISGRKLDSLDVPAPDVVKMDVEGAEAAVLRGGLETLREHQPILVFSTHGERVGEKCRDLLVQIGYEVTDFGSQKSDHLAEVSQ